jgi:polysaccharide pyruvyl transferase WcaK-like protein
MTRIAIWGHYHGGNLGDELVVSTMIDAARRRVPGAEIIGVSLYPADTTTRHGIPAYPINPRWSLFDPLEPVPARPAGRLRNALRRVPPIRRLAAFRWSLRQAIVSITLEAPFLWHSYRLLRRIDAVFVAGSGALEDPAGCWRHPYTAFRWSLLARLARVPMVFPSIGAGPIDSRLSGFFIRHTVARAALLTVRDRDAARVLVSNGAPGPLAVVPDMAFALPESLRNVASRPRPLDPEQLVVGVNVMAYRDPRYTPKGDEGDYEEYIDKMATFTKWLLDEGHRVILFSSQTRADNLTANDVGRLLKERTRYEAPQVASVIDQIHDVPDLIEVITSCDAIVAARFHSILLALLFGIPVLGLAYHAKTTELLADAGQPERFLDIGASSGSDLTDAFRKLAAGDPPDRRDDQRARIAAHRALVEQQFDTLFASLRVSSATDSWADAGATVSQPEGQI